MDFIELVQSGGFSYHKSPPTVQATVSEIWPTTGLAFLAGDDGIEWTVTRSTPGFGLEGLDIGSRVRLTIDSFGAHQFVREYDRPA